MADRTWNAIDARLYEEDWSQAAKLIAGVLLARCPNQYGVFDMPLWFIEMTFQGIFDRKQIEAAMDEWVEAGFVKFYRDRSVVWIVKKWRRAEKFANWKHIKGLHSFLDSYPEVKNDFLLLYDIESLPNESPTNAQSLQSGKQRYTDSESESDSDPEPEEKKKTLPPKDGGVKKPDVASRKKPAPIEERKMTTPAGRLIKFWHVEYFRIHNAKYNGDIKRMGGQAKTLLKRQDFGETAMGMLYLLELPQDQYHPHTFDHFIKKVSYYITEAKKNGYKAVN